MSVKNLKELNEFYPYLYGCIISDNENYINEKDFENIASMADKILASLKLDIKSESYRLEMIRAISELVSSNMIIFDDPNFEWTEMFLSEFFSGNSYVISDTKDDLKLLIISSLSLAVKEYLNFHNNLFFSDQIDLKKMQQLNKNMINKAALVILESISYIQRELGDDFLKEHVKLSGRVYAYALSGLFSALEKNPEKISDYIRAQNKFLSNVESLFLENYSMLVIKGNLIMNNLKG